MLYWAVKKGVEQHHWQKNISDDRLDARQALQVKDLCSVAPAADPQQNQHGQNHLCDAQQHIAPLLYPFKMEMGAGPMACPLCLQCYPLMLSR